MNRFLSDSIDGPYAMIYRPATRAGATHTRTLLCLKSRALVGSSLTFSCRPPISSNHIVDLYS